MFNTGLKRFETANVDNFTSDVGIKLRRAINKPWRNLLKYFISRKVIIEQYPELEKDKVYIFAANHSFDEDVISTIHTMDRNAYVINGSSNQTEHNQVFYALWFNGMIFVNRLDPENRKDAVQKMKRILQAGNSVMLFAEGGYNNTENELIMPLFSSPYTLSKELEVEVVPLITFNDYGTDTIYIRAGQPLALWKYEKYEAPIYVDAFDEYEEKQKEFEEKFATVRFSVWEEKGVFKRENIDLWEYQNFIIQKQNSFPQLDFEQENSCVYGNDDEFYQYFYLNAVPCDAWGTLLQTEKARQIEMIWKEDKDNTLEK